MTYGPRNTPPKQTTPVDKTVIHANLVKSSAEAIEALRGTSRGRNREAIPWCTTHHRSVEPGGQLMTEPLKCGVSTRQWGSNRTRRAVSHLGFRWADFPTPCEVSQGGPDHKWWKDT